MERKSASSASTGSTVRASRRASAERGGEREATLSASSTGAPVRAGQPASGPAPRARGNLDGEESRVTSAYITVEADSLALLERLLC